MDAFDSHTVGLESPPRAGRKFYQVMAVTWRKPHGV